MTEVAVYYDATSGGWKRWGDHKWVTYDTTRRIILWLCEMGVPWPERVYVHSANPVGREWLEGMIEHYGPGVTRW